MEDHETAFDLTVINPDIVLGPMLHPVSGPKSVNETNRFAIFNFLNGTYTDIESVRFPYYHFVRVTSSSKPRGTSTNADVVSYKVDVRDVAHAHVLALTAPGASGKRILLVSGLITPQLVVNTIRKHFPHARERVGEGNPEQILPKGVDPTGWDVSRSHEIFGKDWSYRGLEETVTDTVGDILAHEKVWAGKGAEV